MKKKLVLITLDIAPKEKYVKDLRDFFEDYLEIEGYSLKEGIDEIINGDLALITSPVLTNIVKKYLPEDIEHIYMNRTFLYRSLEKLYKLPQGTKAMLVSNMSIGAVGAMSTLYEIGVKHIDFTPVYPNMNNIPNIKTAVTPGQVSYVPSWVEKVVDIGWRVLDLSTLIDIGTKLDIMNKKLEEKLGIYAQEIVPISYGLHSIFDHTSKNKKLMDMVLNIVNDGVCVTDAAYNIIHCNESIGRMLEIDTKKFDSTKVKKSIMNLSLWRKITNEKNLENTLMKSLETNKSFIVTKKSIDVYNKSCGYVVILKDVTEIQNLETQLRKQLVEKGYISKYHFEDIAGTSKTLVECINRGKKIAKIDAPVLITGESGTGKEMFAQSMHNASKRSNKPFVAINCAALPSQLLESELFGYEEGAFTGARKGGKKGLFELAHTGTIFLDEIGDIPINVQVKLLRVLQEKEVMRIGGTNIIPIDVRVIAATNQNLKLLMEKGTFRMDLYYRLNVFSLHLLPLRERKEDINLLIKDLLFELGFHNRKIDTEAMEVLLNYSWNGNVRELRNCIEYMVYMGGELLTKKDLPEDIKNTINKKIVLKEKSLFPELSYKEEQIAVFILELLKRKNCGRRLVYSYALEDGFETTEHEIRKIMNFLCGKQLVVYGKGRSGAKLTDEGKKILCI
ncbi:MAG: sigma 54-interacting transcriptional regulator [Marinisporobacter sp.]|nr:sigma 54-interacting transcriptional regulator [Marinisporobacter sp.]